MGAITIPGFNDKHLEQNFERIFGARPNTDDLDRAHAARASFWIEYLNKTLLLDGIPHKTAHGNKVDLAAHVCDDLAGFMTTAHCVELVRAALRDDAAACLLIVKTLATDTIKRHAEMLAEDE